MAFLTDGFSTTILVRFSGGGPVAKEITITPPGIDGGGEVDTTTMRNVTYRTKQPKKLITLTQMEVTLAYDPEIYTAMIEVINVIQLVTVTFSDGSVLTFYGWIDKWKPNAIKEGERPTADMIICVGNIDESGNEVSPTLTPVGGTNLILAPDSLMTLIETDRAGGNIVRVSDELDEGAPPLQLNIQPDTPLFQ